MPKFGKYRIKNHLSCLIFVNPALIPIWIDFKSESMILLATKVVNSTVTIHLNVL